MYKYELVKLLENGRRQVTLLDGDIVRINLSSELGFSRSHRDLNIQINNYGSENIDYITDKVFKKLLQKPISAITKLIELKQQLLCI